MKELFEDILMIVMYGLLIFFDYCIVYEIKCIWENFLVEVFIVKNVGYDIYVDNVGEFNGLFKEILSGIKDEEDWMIVD